MLATLIGARAIMKQDEYGFTLLKFDRVIPYSKGLFAFSLHVQQVFLADKVDKPCWKVVLQKDLRILEWLQGLMTDRNCSGSP
jgi:hypothetical protein